VTGLIATPLRALAIAITATVIALPLLILPRSAAAVTPGADVAVKAHTYAAAGPEAQLAGYLTREVVASRSGTLTFVNEDIVQHDFNSPTGLFWTPLIGLDKTATVQGLQNLLAGKRYPFFCTIHPGMTGTLVVIA
jgi:plastocyanin